MEIQNPAFAKQQMDPRQLDQLLHRLSQGEVEAMEALYAGTHASIYGLAFSYVHQQQDAEDVTHDVYIDVFKAASRYVSQGKPLAWMFTITKNRALMKIRERAKWVDLDDHDLKDPTAEKQSLSMEDKMVLETYLRELGEDEQRIVVLHAVSGWKHREIARFMEMTTPHVIVKYNRAIKKLARKFNSG
jgi:RNA polymerase sigma-70 factor (ECF subfamily)